MRAMKKTRSLVALMLVVVLGGMHAAAAASGVKGTTDSAILARLEDKAAASVSPNGMATPGAAFVAFLAGYIVADLLHHFGRYTRLRLPAGASDRLFDF